MSAGKPVVATRVGGNPELVINGDTGILVPVNSISAMAKALHILLEDPNRRESMGSAGRRRVEEHFQHDRMVFQYRELYRSIT
jgi:glycosyltransferase involved in cell wall biosynthesis